MKTYRRRVFLRQVAGAAGALSVPQIVSAAVLGKGGEVAPSNRTTVGCIGVGGRGTAVMRGILELPHARVVAVCDVYEDRREKARNMVDNRYGGSGCAASGDFRELLARSDVDAVTVAAQDHWHGPMAVAAAAAGKAIYCEKPLGVAVEESRAIRDAARRYGTIFQTGLQQRSDWRFRFACELAINGYLGRIHTVQVAAPGPHYKPVYKGPLDAQPVPPGLDWDMWLGPAPHAAYNPGRVAWPDWYLIWDYCAGFIVNWGVHHLDIALWGCPLLGQEPFEVQCTAAYRDEGFTDNVDGWHATFRYAGGLKMVYSDEGRQKIGCRFIGDEGWVHADRSGIWAEPESLLKARPAPGDVRLHESAHHQADFLAAVRSGCAPVADADAGHKASYLGMVADIAARVGRPLRWDPERERFAGDAEADRMLGRPERSPWRL